MNNLTLNEKEIENMIYEINGIQVMLDSDLAKLYNVETKRINEAVKNNPNKFPKRFSFRLNDEESKSFLVENLDQKIETRGGRFKNPRVFTEQGVAMLATILKSKTAIEISIRIMDAFVSMRHYLLENKDIYKSLNNLNNKVIEHDDKLKYLFSKFSLNGKVIKKEVKDNYYSYIKSIFNDANNELIIIDSYADIKILNLIKELNISVILITSKKAKLSKSEIDEYNKKYHNLTCFYNETYHDRYFILDRKIFYLCGTSINYIGNNDSTIVKIEDVFMKEDILKKVTNLIN